MRKPTLSSLRPTKSVFALVMALVMGGAALLSGGTASTASEGLLAPVPGVDEAARPGCRPPSWRGDASGASGASISM